MVGRQAGGLLAHARERRESLRPRVRIAGDEDAKLQLGEGHDRDAHFNPKPGAPDFETAEQLYIDPEVCIDCDACVEACPIDAIFPDFELPEKYEYALDLNAEFFAERSTAERTAA